MSTILDPFLSVQTFVGSSSSDTASDPFGKATAISRSINSSCVHAAWNSELESKRYIKNFRRDCWILCGRWFFGAVVDVGDEVVTVVVRVVVVIIVEVVVVIDEDEGVIMAEAERESGGGVEGVEGPAE